MPANETKKKYNLQYAKNKLKRIPLDVKKEKYEEIKAAADAAGEPVNGYIKKAIDERMKRDATDSATQQTPEPQSPKPSAKKPEKHYKPFTEEDARRIDLQKLLTDVRYQLNIMENFGSEILSELLETARQQPANTQA